MAYTEQQLKEAARKALAAGDTAAAKRLIDAARSAGAVPAPQQAATPEATPAATGGGFDIGTGQLMRSGPGPTGQIDPALYEIGAIGRRMQPGTPETPSTVSNAMADMGGALVAGMGRGAAAIADAPADIANLGMNAVAGLTGQPVSDTLRRGVMAAMPGGMGINRAINGPNSSVRQTMSDVTGGASEFRGETTAGQFAGTVGEFIPGTVALGGGGAANLIKNAVIPGLASEAAGRAFEGTGLEGAARLIGGVGGSVAANIGTKAFQNAFRMSAERPSLESLRTTKNVAYAAVDDAGEKFASTELKDMVANIRTALDDVNYLPEADVATTGLLQKLELVSARDVTLGQLDKMRQAAWTRYGTTKEPGLLDIIEGIDDLVASRSSTSDLLDAARLANGRYKKAELLDLAFQKAADQTAATGSGGNILNKYRQAVTSIINNPKQAKWFTPDEIGVMREFVRGTPGQNAMRLIGKLSPSGNGLMTALNLGAAGTFGAPALAISAGASAAKAVADGATERAAQGLIGRVAGQSVQAAPTTPTIAPYVAGLNALSGYGR